MNQEDRRERRKRIAERVAQGEDLREVAQSEGVGLSTVRTSCKEFGVEYPETLRITNVYLRVLERLDNGEALSEIRKSEKIGDRPLHLLSKKTGIPIPREYQRKPSRALAILKEIITTTKSMNQIAREMGVSRQRVYEINNAAREVDFPGARSES